MDKAWQKNLLAFLGLIAAVFSVFAYLRTATGSESHQTSYGIESKLDALELKIEKSKGEILSEMAIRRSARDKEINTLSSNFNEKFIIIMQGINKLDDRLYEMQQKKTARSIDSDLDGS